MIQEAKVLMMLTLFACGAVAVLSLLVLGSVLMISLFSLTNDLVEKYWPKVIKQSESAEPKN